MKNLLEQFKEVCRIYNIHPTRSKGQNFLIEENIYDKIVQSADIRPNDTILEVGPGLGMLTAKLAKVSKKVIAVELDDKLASYLKSAVNAQRINNVEIINRNILDENIEEKKYKIVANLPYNITSVFIRKFLSEITNKPEMLVLMLQKEVAERIISKSGDMSLLSISVQFYADAEIIEYVPKHYFWPAPEVDSAIIRLKLREKRFNVDEKMFFRLVKIGFSAKRKMLKNNLSAGFKISPKEAEERVVKTGFNPKVRAEQLSIENWINLLEQFRENMV